MYRRFKKYDSGAITVNGKRGIQLQSFSLPAHIKPMEVVKLFAKWNKTKIDYLQNRSVIPHNRKGVTAFAVFLLSLFVSRQDKPASGVG